MVSSNSFPRAIHRQIMIFSTSILIKNDNQEKIRVIKRHKYDARKTLMWILNDLGGH